MLRGDVDGDSRADGVTVRVDRKRPRKCRHVVVAELGGGRSVVARVKPLPWYGSDPRLLLLAEIDGRDGVEAVVSMSPAAVYGPEGCSRSGMASSYACGLPVPICSRSEDEFPAGSDCAWAHGRIVVTTGEVGRPDSHYDVVRSVYEAQGARFQRLRTERFRVEVGTEARGAPFRMCRHLVDWHRSMDAKEESRGWAAHKKLTALLATATAVVGLATGVLTLKDELFGGDDEPAQQQDAAGSLTPQTAALEALAQDGALFFPDAGA